MLNWINLTLTLRWYTHPVHWWHGIKTTQYDQSELYKMWSIKTWQLTCKSCINSIKSQLLTGIITNQLQGPHMYISSKGDYRIRSNSSTSLVIQTWFFWLKWTYFSFLVIPTAWYLTLEWAFHSVLRPLERLVQCTSNSYGSF